MFKAGLVLKKGPTDNVFDAIRKGYPVREIAQGKRIEVPPTVGQQEASAATQKIEENKPDVVQPGPQQTCPPGYTYALGYCVRDVNYYGCIPGVEFWDGTKCSRAWPKCSEGITNDLNTGQCLGDTPKLGAAEQAVIDMWGPGSNATKDALLAEIAKQQQPGETTPAAQAVLDIWAPGSNATKDALLAEIAKQQQAAAPIPVQTTEATPVAPTPLPAAPIQPSVTNDDMGNITAKFITPKIVDIKRPTTNLIDAPVFDTSVPEEQSYNSWLSQIDPLLLENPMIPTMTLDGTLKEFDPNRNEVRTYDSSMNLLDVSFYQASTPSKSNTRNYYSTTDNSLAGAVQAARSSGVKRTDDGIGISRRR